MNYFIFFQVMYRLNNNYIAPQADWNELAPEELVCDSYGSGIEDFEYEDLNWTVTP